MFKKIILATILLIWLFLFSWFTNADADEGECEGIKLNTDFPWTENRCIPIWEEQEVFWWIMWNLMKLAVNMTIAIAFIALIASWVMMSMSWVSQWTAWKWKELIKKVVLWIVLLWLSWLILHAINPNFFTVWW